MGRRLAVGLQVDDRHRRRVVPVLDRYSETELFGGDAEVFDATAETEGQLPLVPVGDVQPPFFGGVNFYRPVVDDELPKL